MVTKRNFIPGEYEIVTQENAGVIDVGSWQYFVLDDYYKFSLADVVVFSGVGNTLVNVSNYELAIDQKYTDIEAEYSGKQLYAMIKFLNVALDGEQFSVTAKNFGTMTDNEATKQYIDDQIVGIVTPESQGAVNTLNVSDGSGGWLETGIVTSAGVGGEYIGQAGSLAKLHMTSPNIRSTKAIRIDEESREPWATPTVRQVYAYTSTFRSASNSFSYAQIEAGRLLELSTDDETITINMNADIQNDAWFDFNIIDLTNPSKTIVVVSGLVTETFENVTGAFRIWKYSTDDFRVIRYSDQYKQEVFTITDGMTIDSSYRGKRGVCNSTASINITGVLASNGDFLDFVVVTTSGGNRPTLTIVSEAGTATLKIENGESRLFNLGGNIKLSRSETGVATSGTLGGVLSNAGGGDFVVDGSGNVTLPTAIKAGQTTLTTNGSNFTTIQGENTNLAIMMLTQSGGSRIGYIGRYSEGTVASPTAITASGIQLVALLARGHDGTAWTDNKGAIGFYTGGTWSSGATPTYCSIFTTNGGATVQRAVATFHENGTASLPVAAIADIVSRGNKAIIIKEYLALTTAGDMIYATTGGQPVRLPKGTAGQVLAMNSGATAPEWKTLSTGGLLVSPTYALVDITDSLAITNTAHFVKWICPMDMTITKIRCYVTSASATGTKTLGIYSGNTLLQSASVDTSSTGLRTATITSQAVTGGSEYYLAINDTGGAANYGFKSTYSSALLVETQGTTGLPSTKSGSAGTTSPWLAVGV